jgi:lysozyme
MDLRSIIKKDEGLRLKVYKDIFGNDTIGYGFALAGFDKDDAEYFLNKKIQQAIQYLLTFSWYKSLNDARKAVVVSMVYNLGMNGFGKFKRLIGALEKRDFDLSADEIIDSNAAKQLQSRYQRFAKMMRSGCWLDDK